MVSSVVVCSNVVFSAVLFVHYLHLPYVLSSAELAQYLP